MTTTAVVKASKAVKGSTTIVSAAVDAFDRAKEIYYAQIKRAEAEYFDRIARIERSRHAMANGDAGAASEAPSEMTPESERVTT